MSARIALACTECGEPQHARGLCQFHYDRARRSGKIKSARQTRTDVLKRDVHGHKLCIRCRDWKSESEYSSNASRRDGLSPYCKQCVKDLWVEQERDKRYGLQPGTVQSIFEAQEFRCAICGMDIDNSAQVDHDHACCPGRGGSCGACVRGVLCKPCNMLLGSARDSVEILRAAVRYLEKWGDARLAPNCSR